MKWNSYFYFISFFLFLLISVCAILVKEKKLILLMNKSNCVYSICIDDCSMNIALVWWWLCVEASMCKCWWMICLDFIKTFSLIFILFLDSRTSLYKWSIRNKRKSIDSHWDYEKFMFPWSKLSWKSIWCTEIRLLLT